MSTLPVSGAAAAAGEKPSPAAPENRAPQTSSSARQLPRWLASLLRIVSPNQILSSTATRILFAGEIVFLIFLWSLSPLAVIPRPGEVVQALGDLWMNQGLAQDLGVSFMLNVESLAISTAISLVLAYLTALPIFRPVAQIVSKGRFLSLAGFSLVFTLVVGGGHPLKVSLMVFGMTVFYLTSMLAVVDAVPRAEYDHARTLRMSEWRVVWEVIVLGTLDKAFEVMRQNAAIGWMMLTMVEGIVRAEGGVGTLLLTQGKHFHVAHVFAIQGVILLVGLLQDAAIGGIRRILFPYAALTVEKGR